MNVLLAIISLIGLGLSLAALYTSNRNARRHHELEQQIKRARWPNSTKVDSWEETGPL